MLAEHCREATQIRILLGPPIFDDDEGFNTMVDESFEPADELGIIPIFKTISDGPRPPVLNLVAVIAEGVWGRMESRMDSLPIGTSGGLPVIRHVQLLRKV
jgi:hypothetical protein